VSLAWLLARPTVSGLIIGARNADQLRDNLAAADLKLTPEQTARLDAASAVTPAYPYWHQQQSVPMRIPLPV
jgi:aryl-alcohol dehydrogenase-like predicted oxidoreductase